MKKEIAVAMVVMTLSLVSVVSVNTNQAGDPYLDKIDSPDFFQTDPDYGGFEGGGGTYCGPVAASNALMWLDAHGFGNIVDDTTDRKKDQHDLIDILGSENYMDSIDGTGAFGLTRGLNRYLNERGYNVTFRSEGWRNVPDYVNVLATKPQVPWIKEAVTGANSGCLLNVGWYEYYNNNNTYVRKGGH